MIDFLTGTLDEAFVDFSASVCRKLGNMMFAEWFGIDSVVVGAVMIFIFVAAVFTAHKVGRGKGRAG